VAKLKGIKMIERIDYYVGGPLNKLTTEEIILHTNDYVKGALLKCNMEPIDTSVQYNRALFSRALFSKDHVSINSKNMEFMTSWHFLERVVPDKELQKVLDKYEIGDVLIQLYVYRLGQYSYFACACTILFGGDIPNYCCAE
jgi:hypothetical protein